MGSTLGELAQELRNLQTQSMVISTTNRRKASNTNFSRQSPGFLSSQTRGRRDLEMQFPLCFQLKHQKIDNSYRQTKIYLG